MSVLTSFFFRWNCKGVDKWRVKYNCHLLNRTEYAVQKLKWLRLFIHACAKRLLSNQFCPSVSLLSSGLFQYCVHYRIVLNFRGSKFSRIAIFDFVEMILWIRCTRTLHAVCQKFSLKYFREWLKICEKYKIKDLPNFSAIWYAESDGWRFVIMERNMLKTAD